MARQLQCRQGDFNSHLSRSAAAEGFVQFSIQEKYEHDIMHNTAKNPFIKVCQNF